MDLVGNVLRAEEGVLPVVPDVHPGDVEDGGVPRGAGRVVRVLGVVDPPKEVVLGGEGVVVRGGGDPAKKKPSPYFGVPYFFPVTLSPLNLFPVSPHTFADQHGQSDLLPGPNVDGETDVIIPGGGGVVIDHHPLHRVVDVRYLARDLFYRFGREENGSVMH